MTTLLLTAPQTRSSVSVGGSLGGLPETLAVDAASVRDGAICLHPCHAPSGPARLYLSQRDRAGCGPCSSFLPPGTCAHADGCACAAVGLAGGGTLRTA